MSTLSPAEHYAKGEYHTEQAKFVPMGEESTWQQQQAQAHFAAAQAGFIRESVANSGLEHYHEFERRDSDGYYVGTDSTEPGKVVPA